MSTDRDLKMGRALASIPLPELSDGYYSRLAEDLKRARPASSRARRRRPRMMRVGLVAAAVAAVAAIFGFAVLPGLRGTDTATAADMLASMNAAAGHARVVRLAITDERVSRAASSPPSDARKGSSSAPRRTNEQLTLSTAGDIRYTLVRQLVDAMGTDVETHTIETYDAGRHEMMRQGRTVPVESTATPGAYPYHRRRGALGIERPSWGTTVFSTYLYANFQALSNSLRARLAEGDPNAPVTQSTYLGRPAWHADLTERMPSSDGRSPDGLLVTWSVTVDKQTGLLVASDLDPGSDPDELKGLARSFRVTHLEVDPQLPDGWQRISPSGQSEISIFDRGTRFGTPEAVAERSWPTLVLIPQTVPAGYRLTDVATRDYEGMSKSPQDQGQLIYLTRHDPREYIWKRTSVDASVQRVMVRYRRGFSTFTVAIKPLQNGGGSLGDGESGLLGAEAVTLTAGYLEGERARTWISPYFGNGPTLITYSDRSRITVTGDLTRQELIDVANSFRAYGDVTRPLPEEYGE
jgi:hypothetical protein